MSKAFILQLIIIFIVVYIAVSIFIILLGNKKEKRISNYSLSKKDFDNTTFLEKLSHFLWRIVHLFTNKLSRNKKVIKYSSRYEKYIYIKEEKYKSPIDYFTVKIFTIILSCLIYLVLILIDVLPFNILILFIFIIIGFVLPDFFWELLFIKKCKKVSNGLYESIIILDDNISRTNIYNAINKVINSTSPEIADEYQRILTDLSYNISLYQAFKRFYERTKIPEIKVIYHLLNIEQEDLKSVFSLIRNEFSYIDKANSSKIHTNIILNILNLIFIFIPILLVFIISILDINYFKTILSTSVGVILIEVIVVVYIVLVYFIKLVGGDKR